MKAGRYLMHYCGGLSLEYDSANTIKKLKRKFRITEVTPEHNYRIFKADNNQIIEIGLNGREINR